MALGLDELSAQYGYAAAFFFSDPELTKLINQAVTGQWSPDRFRAAFMATNWYRSHSGDVRMWLELKSRDPAEAQHRIDNQKFKIQQLANQMGISLDSSRLAKMAEDSLMFGWSDPLLQQMVGSEYKYTGGQTGTGQAADLQTRIRQLASDYGVTVSDSQVAQWVGGALQGRYTENTLDDFVRDMAKSKYPGLNKYIDQGMTVRQVASPYMQSYSQLLETSVDSVDLNDPLIQQALQGYSVKGSGTQPKAPPGQTGPPKPTGAGVSAGPSPQMAGVQPTNPTDMQPMSLYDFERQVRKDPRWLRTKNAMDSMQNAALGILQDMGLYA